MKKLTAALCVFGTALALSACTTGEQGYIDNGPPYGMERTAGGGKAAVTSAPVRTYKSETSERTFTKAQRK